MAFLIVGALLFIGVIIFCIGSVKLLIKKLPREAEAEPDLEIGVPLRSYSQTAVSAQRGGLPTLLRSFNSQAANSKACAHQCHSDQLDEVTTQASSPDKKRQEEATLLASGLSGPTEADDEKKFPVLTGAHGWQVEVKGLDDINPAWANVCEYLQDSDLKQLSLGKKNFFRPQVALRAKRRFAATGIKMRALLAEGEAVLEKLKALSR
eukprot:symbB.v1.2.012610.t1/scaffold874.1/size155782/4